MNHRYLLNGVIVVALSLALRTAWAEAPVVDISSADTPSGTSTVIDRQANAVDSANTTTSDVASTLTIDQRIARVEQQVANLNNMNLSQQVNDLQQQLAELRGQLQIQARDLQLLSQERNLPPMGHAAPSNTLPHTTPTRDIAVSGEQASASEDVAAYQAAFNGLTQKEYEKSRTAFNDYLSRYPGGSYVSNVHYWLGEIYLLQKKPDQAATEFQVVIQQFPNSSKWIDAQLKLAILHADAGQIVQARRELEQIKKSYPNSTAAQLASIRLQQLDVQNTAPPATPKSS